MRLRSEDIQIIIRIAKEIYGENVKVYLFGSRTDDTKRGEISICLSVPWRKRKEFWLVSACFPA